MVRLHDEIQRRVINSDVRQQLVNEGYEVSGLGLDQYGKFVKAELVKWAKVIRDANVPLQ